MIINFTYPKVMPPERLIALIEGMKDRSPVTCEVKCLGDVEGRDEYQYEVTADTPEAFWIGGITIGSLMVSRLLPPKFPERSAQ